ncbi:hypothetical protein ColKHC_06269 [Colletotrichum higginsianum]|nr:hypothetical protein ColKHC_06269 [Colletotrichum higginsianum]
MAEATEPTMDCNLPELLAQDLEFSSLIFAAKNMTAGAPPPALASDEDDWQSTAEPPTVLGATCHPNAVPQFQPLAASSQKRVVSFGGEYEGSFDSWMDFEPDAPVDYPELGKSLAQSPVTTPVKPARPLSRLGDRSINESSPRRAKSANAAATTRRLSNPFEGYTRPASRARSMYSDPMTAAAKEQNRHSIHSLHSLTSLDMAVPTRSSSLKHRVSFTDDARKAITSRSRSRSHASSTNVPDPVAVQGTNRSSVISDLKEELEPWFRYLDAQDEQPQACPQASLPLACDTTPGIPLQRLTDSYPDASSSLSGPSQVPPDLVPEHLLHLARGPNRHPSAPSANRPRGPPTGHAADLAQTLALVLLPPDVESRQRRPPLLLPRLLLEPRPPLHHATVDFDSHSAPVVPYPKHLPHGSDYLCDALYAHIVAYNYLAPMVHNPPTGGAGRPPTPGSPASTEDPIPKKAATLLGLQGCQETTTPKPLRKRSSMFLGLRASSWQSTFAAPPPSVPTTPLTAAPPPPASDIPLRDLQHGLHRCIARLVTTLRVEGSEGPIAGEPINDVDPLVMRSLCEIVKCCEESPTNDRSL